jgi:hypothetical protein
MAWVAKLGVTEPSPERRRTLWTPWMTLPLSFHYGLETFFESVYRTGLDEEAPFFVDAISEILSYLIRDGWLKPGGSGFRASGPALHAIGRGRVVNFTDRWRKARAPVAVALAPLWRAWLIAAHSWHGCLGGFCELLGTAAFEGIRVQGILWLAELDLGRPLLEVDAQEALVRLLDKVVHEHTHRLGDGGQEALEHLLGTLVAVGNKRAIVLSAELGTSRGSGRIAPGPAGNGGVP